MVTPTQDNLITGYPEAKDNWLMTSQRVFEEWLQITYIHMRFLHAQTDRCVIAVAPWRRQNYIANRSHNALIS